MAKPKFSLTSDLVKVEPEPDSPVAQHIVSEPQKPVKVIEEKEQLNLKISRDLKKRFQVWCLHNEKSMTESLEKAILDIIED